MSEVANSPLESPKSVPQTYFRWLNIAFVCSLLLPIITGVCSYFLADAKMLSEAGAWRFALIPASLLYFVWYGSRKMDKLRPIYMNAVDTQEAALDKMSIKTASIIVVVTACLSLFLELVLIRWQSSLFEFFSFYKNFSLLACFCGLGTGYALASKRPVPIICTPILLAWQVALFLLIKFGLGGLLGHCLKSIPVTDVWFMGCLVKAEVGNYIGVYSLLTTTFILTALTMLPIGQICGRMMSKKSPLESYGLNLAGSIAGVLLMMGMTAAWAPPTVWFAIVFLLCLVTTFNRSLSVVCAVSALLTIAVLDLPLPFGTQKIYSPYQLLELEPGDRGLNSLRAAGTYYQKMIDLSPQAQGAWDEAHSAARHYELPFKSAPSLDNVAVIGAGTGNDVAAALRSGAKHVYAVEIDPAIYELGAMYHPELPYKDPRVQVVIDDGRAFLHRSNEKFDAIVFGLVDSHALSSQATSLRVDSYIYTVDALREARSHLKDNGILSLSFAVPTAEVGKKIYRMMTNAFDGHAPECLVGGYDGDILYVQSKNGELKLPESILKSPDLKNGRLEMAASKEPIDVSTDDWPFFYMIKRQFPWSYMLMTLLVLGLSGGFLRSLNDERPQPSDFVFFLLGAGFMLIETKSITELGLHLGNTSFVITVVVAAIICMAYISNLIVQFTKISSPIWAYALLLLSLLFSWYFAGQQLGSFSPALSATIVLTVPVAFSGIVFSLLLKRSKNIGGAMAMNIFGAMCGGLIEYCAMLTGYKMMYLAAIAIYGLAFILTLTSKKEQAPVAEPAA